MPAIRNVVGVPAAAALVHLVAVLLPLAWMPLLPALGNPETALPVLATASRLALWGSATLVVAAAAFWATRNYGPASYAATVLAYGIAGSLANAGGQWIAYEASTVTGGGDPVDPESAVVVAGVFAASALVGVVLAGQSSGGRGGERVSA